MVVFYSVKDGKRQGGSSSRIKDVVNSTMTGIPCFVEGGLEDDLCVGHVLTHHWMGKGPLAVDVTCVYLLRPSEPGIHPGNVWNFLMKTEQNKP